LPVDQAVEFVLQACEAIADAHGLGIVHRDLKPANLFCIRRSDGLLSIKVLDFGISKVTNVGGPSSDVGMTKATAVMGSPHYMSPEQMESARAVDARTDIWAIGVILYELLTGRVPFGGDSLPEICLKIATHEPLPLRNVRPDAPEGIEQVILKCLEKNRENRYPDVAALALALAPFAPKRARASVERISRVIEVAGLSTRGPVVLPSSFPPPEPAPVTTISSWGQTKPRVWKSKTMPAVITALAGAAIGAVLLMRATRDTAKPEPPGTVTPPVHALAPSQMIAPPVATPAVVLGPPPAIAASARAVAATAPEKLAAPTAPRVEPPIAASKPTKTTKSPPTTAAPRPKTAAAARATARDPFANPD
jgi:eukaryotic-like serine/threonine-protein kinase